MINTRINLNYSKILTCAARIDFIDKLPKIKYVFPVNTSEYIINQLIEFCCPFDAKSAEYFDENVTQIYTFILTNIDSNFIFGYCLYSNKFRCIFCIMRFIESCISVLFSFLNNKSSNPFHSLYNEIIRLLSLYTADHSFSEIEAWLNLIDKTPIPNDETSFSLPNLPFPKMSILKSPSTNPILNIPDDINLTRYVSSIKKKHIINIFIGMLLERRIIFVSKKLSILSSSVLSSIALLYPLNWQHILIPLMPSHLLDYINAPMPFICGVHRSLFLTLDESTVSTCIVCNLDTDELLYPKEFSNDILEFPVSLNSKLYQSLSKSKSKPDKCSMGFYKIVIKLIGKFQSFLENSFENYKFNYESFSSEEYSFRKEFCKTQAFEQFINERIVKLKTDRESVNDHLKYLKTKIKSSESMNKISQSNYRKPQTGRPTSSINSLKPNRPPRPASDISKMNFEKN